MDGWTGDSLSVEVSGDLASQGSVGAWLGSWNRKKTSVGHLLNTGGTWPGVCLWEWSGRGGAVDKEERGEGRRRESTGRGAGWDQWLPVLPSWGWLGGLIYTRKDGELHDAVGWALTDVHTTHHHSNQAEGFHPWRLSLGP